MRFLEMFRSSLEGKYGGDDILFPNTHSKFPQDEVLVNGLEEELSKEFQDVDKKLNGTVEDPHPEATALPITLSQVSRKSAQDAVAIAEREIEDTQKEIARFKEESKVYLADQEARLRDAQLVLDAQKAALLILNSEGIGEPGVISNRKPKAKGNGQ